MLLKITKQLKYFFTAVLIFCAASISWATPPSKIILTYDQDKKILNIDVEHVSSHLRKHHIRKLVVYKNDKEVQTFYYSNQTSSTGLVQDVSLEAKPEDIIKVVVTCTESGPTEEVLTIPAPPTPETPSASSTPPAPPTP